MKHHHHSESVRRSYRGKPRFFWVEHGRVEQGRVEQGFSPAFGWLENLTASAAEVLSRISSVLRATLREIFDEAAYNRFLQRQGMKTSRAAYAAFLQEAQADRARRPRCC